MEQTLVVSVSQTLSVAVRVSQSVSQVSVAGTTNKGKSRENGQVLNKNHKDCIPILNIFRNIKC